MMEKKINPSQYLEKRLHQQTTAPEDVKAALEREILYRQEIEKELEQREEQQQLLFESMLDGYALHEIICNTDGHPIDYRFLFINTEFERLTGLRREQVLGKTVLEVLPETESYWIETFGRVALTGQPVRFENYSKGVDDKWFEVSAFSPTKGQFAVLFRDITERKNTEAALRESEEKYRQIVDTAEEGIWLLDKEGNTTFVNQKMAKMLKYSPEAMLGESLLDFMDEEGKLIAQQNLKRREEGISEQHDFKFRCRDGADLWAIVSTNPIIDDKGEYQGALGMITDITDRRRVQIDMERYARRLEIMRGIDRAILEARAPHLGCQRADKTTATVITNYSSQCFVV